MFDLYQKDIIDLINKVYWDIISDLLNKDITSVKMMKTAFSTIEEIENNMSKTSLNSLIFNDVHDVDLPLQTRLEKYFDETQLTMNINIKNEIERFYFATFSQIQQSLDIIFKCLQFNLIPFIRFDVTFRYFILIGVAFSNDTILKEILTYSIMGYLFSEYIDNEAVYEKDFKTFYNKCKKQHFIESIYNRIIQDGKDIWSYSFEDIINILKEKFIAIMAS